jgi:periplasmic divalent cation tolerance protein
VSVFAVYVVFASQDEAMRIGRIVVEERLAACINVMAPCTSLYWWDGAVTQAEEVPALLKTSSEQANALIARIADLHSYDVPAITAWPAERVPSSFAEWVATEAPVS